MDSSCGAFSFSNNVCTLLKTEFLYKAGTDLTEVFIRDSVVRGNLFNTWVFRMGIFKSKIFWNQFHTSVSSVQYQVSIFPAEDASWTTWTSWDGCRDDRLPSYGIEATSSSYLCLTADSNSNQNILNRRYRTCQNQINNELKYARHGGVNHCLGTQVNGNEEDDIHEERPCSTISSCPRM